MKISEQARKAADTIYTDTGTIGEDAEVIQQAINSHERDLVEAAKAALPEIMHHAVYYDLKAALDRRRE